MARDCTQGTMLDRAGELRGEDIVSPFGPIRKGLVPVEDRRQYGTRSDW